MLAVERVRDSGLCQEAQQAEVLGVHMLDAGKDLAQRRLNPGRAARMTCRNPGSAEDDQCDLITLLSSMIL